MAQSYFAEGIHERPATFSLFARSLPFGWRFWVAAGLSDALDYLEELRFDDEDLAYLRSTGLFSDGFLDYLREFRFTGDVRAFPEGTLFFPDESVLELTAPILAAQIVETYVLNQIHFQSLIATKARRCVDASDGRLLIDFGLRRTHGAEAGLKASRSSYLAGFDATSNVLAGREFEIPITGTMAHSYVEAFESELDAFRAFARSYPDSCVLLVDTYDSIEGTRRAARVGRELAERGHRLRGIRLDSGDLVSLSQEARKILDDADLQEAVIFASGSLDEIEIKRLAEAGAEIGGFGVGSRLGTSADAPYVDMVYKLVEFDGDPTLKLSKGKATWPGRKQVWRVSDGDGFDRDIIGLAYEDGPDRGEPLLEAVMEQGSRVGSRSLEDARRRCAKQRALLRSARYEVRPSDALVALREDLAPHAGGQ